MIDRRANAVMAVLDCFVAELVIGPRDFARARWLLAMTTVGCFSAAAQCPAGAGVRAGGLSEAGALVPAGLGAGLAANFCPR